jgi:hypothetical protein
LVLIVTPSSLIEVLLWSLAGGDDCLIRRRPIQRPRSSARKYRPAPVTPLNSVAGIQCSPQMQSISCSNATSIVRFTQFPFLSRSQSGFSVPSVQ